MPVGRWLHAAQERPSRTGWHAKDIGGNREPMGRALAQRNWTALL
jgi:hypothetical protein